MQLLVNKDKYKQKCNPTWSFYEPKLNKFLIEHIRDNISIFECDSISQENYISFKMASLAF